MPHATSRVPRWFVALGAVPVVTFAVAARVTDGDPVAALTSAFASQQAAERVAAASLRRGGVPGRRADVLAERATEPPWLVAPFGAALVWVAVYLVGRVRADAGDWWAWVLLALAALFLVLTVVDLLRRGVRRARAGLRARAAARGARRGARVA